MEDALEISADALLTGEVAPFEVFVDDEPRGALERIDRELKSDASLRLNRAVLLMERFLSREESPAFGRRGPNARAGPVVGQGMHGVCCAARSRRHPTCGGCVAGGPALGRPLVLRPPVCRPPPSLRSRRYARPIAS